MWVVGRFDRRTGPFWRTVDDAPETVPAPVAFLGQSLVARVRVTPEEAVRVCAWARRRIGDTDPRRSPLLIADAAGRAIWPPPRRPSAP